MSNRNFDNRVIISRLQNQVYARNLYANNTSGQTLINNPQNSDGTASRYNSYTPGAQTEYFRGLRGGETISVGGIVNISPYAPIPPPSVVVPSAPTITSINSGNQELFVNFTPPTSDGGSMIIDYEYSVNGGIYSSGTTESPIIISGLTNGNIYEIRLYPINVVGIGMASNPVFATPATVPSAPIITSFNVTTPVPIFFTQGSDGGSEIINYEYSTDNGVTFIPFSPATTTSPVIMSELTTGVIYTVVLSAVNIIGRSVKSNPVTVMG